MNVKCTCRAHDQAQLSSQAFRYRCSVIMATTFPLERLRLIPFYVRKIYKSVAASTFRQKEATPCETAKLNILLVPPQLSDNGENHESEYSFEFSMALVIFVTILRYALPPHPSIIC
jgi:hypothetical protein